MENQALPKPKRGEIWYVENNNFTSHEMGFTRPAIVVSNDKCNTFSTVIEIIYLTTTPKKDMPTHVSIKSAPRRSTALCENVYSIDVCRLKEKCGELTESEQMMVDNALLISLGIDALPPQNQVGGAKPDTIHNVQLKELQTELNVYKKMYNDILERVMK